MFRPTLRLVVATVLLASAGLLASPAAVPINLATAAPSNSIWHKALLDMGAAWSKSGVTLTVFPDGSQGSEDTVVQKMRLGNLQAALLTAGGLSVIATSFNVFGMPFFFETDEEELAVQKKLEPRLEEIAKRKGFHLLCWGTAGWVQVFSKKPLKSLADVKAAKLYTSKEDDRMYQWYTRNGFHPVQLTLADIAPQLKLPTGMIDTTPNTPYIALITQIFGNAKYMLDLHIAPFVGAMVVTTSAWNKLSPADQTALTDAARALEARVRAEAPRQDATSIQQMTARGLQVITLDAKAAGEFRAAAADMVRSMKGDMVPADIYEMAVTERDAVRKKGR
jgi:TRAP-type transport system periplasmic protein